MDRITLNMSDENKYPIIEWVDENEDRVAAIVAHEKSNPKDGVTYYHRHITMPYVTDSNGKLIGRVDVPYGHDHTQIQVEHADLVMKGRNCSVILRSTTGKTYWKLEIDDSGSISTSKVDNSDIIKANNLE